MPQVPSQESFDVLVAKVAAIDVRVAAMEAGGPVDPPPPADPVITSFVYQFGQLVWTSANGQNASLDGGEFKNQAVNLSGTVAVEPAKITTYTLTVTGAPGTMPATAEVEVPALPPSPPPPSGGRLEIEPGQHVTILENRSYSDGVFLKAGGRLTTAANIELEIGNEFIIEGEWEQLGSSFSRIAAAAGDLPAGTTIIDCIALPHGWQVGDVILIPASGKNSVTEERTIRALDSSRVTVDALTYPHPAGRDGFGLIAGLPRIVNRSRFNLTIKPAPGKTYHTRIQWDHHAGNPPPRGIGPIRSVALIGGGKTTTAVVTDDDGANPIGFYCGFHGHHIHEAGANWVFEDCFVDGQQTTEDGRKWGNIAHHTQGMTFKDCIVWRCAGAGFVTEDPDAKGNWFIGNLAFDIIGTGTRDDQTTVSRPGTSGDGYYFAGLDNHVIGNAAMGCGSAGFSLVGSARSRLDNCITDFRGNEPANCKIGIEWWNVQADTTWYDPTNTHQNRIVDLLAWNIRETGALGYPCHNLSLVNPRIYGCYTPFNPGDYLHVNCIIENPDFVGTVGVNVPLNVGQEPIEPGEKTFVIRGGRIKCTASSGVAAVSIATPNGPSLGSLTARRTIIDSVILDAPIHVHLGRYTGSNTTDDTAGDAVEVRNYLNAGESFGIDWPHKPVPGRTYHTRPKIGGLCYPLGE